MDNVVVNLYAKFDDDHLWNEKALVLITTRTTFVAFGDPFPGLIMKKVCRRWQKRSNTEAWSVMYSVSRQTFTKWAFINQTKNRHVYTNTLSSNLTNFYRAMHFSAFARSCDRMSSVCLSVCLSVCTLVICDHIGWKSWKLIAWAISPTSSLFAAKRRSTYSQGNMEKFLGD